MPRSQFGEQQTDIKHGKPARVVLEEVWFHFIPLDQIYLTLMNRTSYPLSPWREMSSPKFVYLLWIQTPQLRLVLQLCIQLYS